MNSGRLQKHTMLVSSLPNIECKLKLQGSSLRGVAESYKSAIFSHEDG